MLRLRKSIVGICAALFLCAAVPALAAAPTTTQVPTSVLAPITANGFYANVTSGSASPTVQTFPSCSGANQALNYTLASGLGCITITGGGSGATLTINSPLTGTSYNGSTAVTMGCTLCALTSGTLAQFSSTTSAQLAGVISDETGTGSVVFATSPSLVTPALGTPSAVVLTHGTGLPDAGIVPQTANTVLGALTAVSPSGLSLPSCSGAANALTWTSGSGFGCNSISGGGTVSTTGSPASPQLAQFSGATTIGGVTFSVNQQFIIATGTYTPTTGMVYAEFETVGGGGQGGGTACTTAQVCNATGGGAGAYSRCVSTAATVGASQSVTIGAGGSGSTGASTGGGGATTSVGTICTASGGNGGAGVNLSSSFGGGGAGGSSGTGLISNGASGGGALSTTALFGTGSVTPAGQGAPGPWGGAPTVASGGSSAVNGNAGAGCGAGGGGGSENASATATNGGAGHAGCVLVTEYILH